MFIVNLGLNHKTAPLEIREKFSFSENSLPEALDKIRQDACINGCVILSTCNRTEIYAAVIDIKESINAIKSFLSEHSGLDIVEIENHFFVSTCFEAVRHLFCVSSGLDSMILGETQILGQVRKAYEIACKNGSTNHVLNTLFQRAISVGKRVHTETKISQNAVSIGYAAVELVSRIFSDINGKSILIIGAGKISEITVKNLLSKGICSIMVANRSLEKAKVLADKFGGKAINYDELFEYMKDVDIVIACTSATNYIIKFEQVNNLMKLRNYKDICFMDIAVPRNVDPLVTGINGVNLYTIDHLQDVVDSNLEQRKKEAAKANLLIEEEIHEFLKWLNENVMKPIIIELNKKGQLIKEKELNRTLNKLQDLTEQQKNLVRNLANSIVNQLLHQPIEKLKEFSNTPKSHQYAELLKNLFDLEVGNAESKNPVYKEIFRAYINSDIN